MDIHIKLILVFVFFHNIYGIKILNNSTKIVDSHGKAGDRFSGSVAMNNDYLVVGSYGDDENGKTNIGSTSIYTVNGKEFILKDKLVPRDGHEYDYFGGSVQINVNNYVVIGSQLGRVGNVRRGCVHIYHQGENGYTHQKIIANDGAKNDDFGYKVDINDKNEIVVGARDDDDKGSKSGSAYIFKQNNNTWAEVKKFVPMDLSAGDYFGSSVSITDSYFAVGTHGQDSYSGSVYIYKQNNNNQWEQHTKLTSPNKKAKGFFGDSINVQDKRLVIGAPGEGKVYVYVTNGVTWTLEGTLQASDGYGGNYYGFGCSVDRNNNNIVIGAANSGSAYLYQFSNGNWKGMFKLIAADGQASDYFGVSVSMVNNKIVVGSYRNEQYESGSGAAYIFDVSTDSTIKTTPASTTNDVVGSPGNVIDSGAGLINFSILCDEEYMMGIWKRKQFTDKGNLTISLINPTCNQYHQNITHLWIVTNYTKCGTVTIETNSKIIKKNTATVTLTNIIGNLIERGSFIKYNISCEFERRKHVSSSNSFNNMFRYIGTVDESVVAQFSVNIAIYTNYLFNEIAQSHHTVTSYEPIYIGIVESRQNKLLKFVVDTCFATPSSNVNGIPYVFFYQKCHLDDSFAIIENNTDSFKFKIDAFNYIQLSKSTHIHCQLYICISNATSEKCQQSCRMRKRRAISDKVPLKAVTLVTNQIKFQKKINCNELKCPPYSSCIKTYPAICRCNEDHVFNPITNACENKNVFRINGLHLDTEFVPPYLDSTSSIFINFARKIEQQLNYFHIELREGAIQGVQVIRARKSSSVIIDLAVVYGKNSNKEDAYKTFVKSIKNNYTKTLNYPNEIKIKSDITPTMAIPTTLGNRTSIIAVIATLVIIVVSLVVIILIIDCNRAQKKEKQSREETTTALI